MQIKVLYLSAEWLIITRTGAKTQPGLVMTSQLRLMQLETIQELGSKYFIQVIENDCQ